MSLSDGLTIIFNIFSGFLNILMEVQLFGVPFGVFIIAAFIVATVMKFVFNIDSSIGGDGEK